MDLESCADDQDLRCITGSEVVLILDIEVEDAAAVARDDGSVVDRDAGTRREIESVAYEGFDIRIVESPVDRLRICEDEQFALVVCGAAVSDLAVSKCDLGEHDG